MFNFENYRPYFDETEFNDNNYLLPKKEYPKPSKLYKSTATIITSLNQNINIDYLYNFLNIENCDVSRIDFYNQITIVITIDVKKKGSNVVNKRNINTKIFQNGTIHMTGGQSIIDAKRAIRQLINGIQSLRIKVSLPEGINKDKYPEYIYCIDNPDIHFNDFEYSYNMINRHFNTNFEFCPGTLYKILQEKKWRVNYNPNRFSGVVLNTCIKNESVTFLMFKSGKITISLANCTDSIINHSYIFINDIFEKNYNAIVKKEYNIQTLQIQKKIKNPPK